MANLINDGSLVGLWPLLEASGSPTWKNYAPAYANHPSGVSFDFNVHVADLNSITDDDSMASAWPGKYEHFNAESGVLVRGLQLKGRNDQITSNASAPFSKMLVLGNGTYVQRVETLGPAVANSGFTAGLWVYPMSDGWINAYSEGGFSPAADGWFIGNGRVHALMSQAKDDIGWYLGISGQLEGATQFSSEKEGGPHQLRAYVLADSNTAAGAPEVDTPIEANVFTHLTMTYRYVDGSSNEIVLYRNGRVAASGVTSQDIVFDGATTTGPDASILNLGGSNDGTYGTDAFEFTSGWDHLVSGAYHFRRVLDENEIMEMHDRGGLQPNLELRNNIKIVDLLDADLIAYVDQRAPGWIDSSMNHHNFICDRDPGDRGTAYTWDPGPFSSNRNYGDGSSLSEFIATPSGATFSLADAPGGFTICGWFMPMATANSRDDSMMISWGSVSSAVAGPATATTEDTLGLCLTYFSETGFGDRVVLEVFPIGKLTDGNLELRAEGEQLWRSTNMHYGIVYDAATNGIALYLDGYQAASGTLTHSLKDHVQRISGSGYPIMFQNGVTDFLVDSSIHGVHANGGDQSSSGPFLLMSRPTLASEMRYIAQSGINTTRLRLTRQDPRLMGYWPCDGVDNGDVVIQDKARAMSPMLGHLTRGESNAKWDRVYNTNSVQPDSNVFRNDGTAFIDFYAIPDIPPELASYGGLGITSGTFVVAGGSYMSSDLTANEDSENSAFGLIYRYKPATEQRNLGPQSIHEWIVSFDVTPSGDIPALEIADQSTAATQSWFNSRVYTYGNIGNITSDGEHYAMLTTLNAESPDPMGAEAGTGGSGVSIVFVGRDGALVTSSVPILSGIVPYGVPSKVLLHAKFDEPYRVNDFLTGNSPMTVSLWINGAKVNQRTEPCTNFRLWTDSPPNGGSDDWLVHFGGYTTLDAVTTQVNVDTGLGRIFMREMLIMRGVFDTGEIESLAVSGIRTSSIPGYTNQVPTTQVTIADSSLEGYWRFNGFEGNIGEVTNSPGGSGTSDLGPKGNHLNAIAQVVFEEGTSVDVAETMRALPGPHRNSSLGVQCSGFHNQSVQPVSTAPNLSPPFAVSGAAFDNPAAGFSVGFLLAKRDDVAGSRFDCMVSYGGMTTAPNGSVSDASVHPNRGWAIGMDDSEQMKMIISTGGNMFLDGVSNGANSGQIICGTTLTGKQLSDLRSFNNFQQGDFRTPGFDNWVHYCWTYNPQPSEGLSGVRCYVNGVLVDERFIVPYKEDGDPLLNPWDGNPIRPQVPLAPESRIISIRSPQAEDPWDFRQLNFFDADSVLTDLFYFSRPLTSEEVRYVAFNGIDAAVGTPTSGLMGGMIKGQDTGSGLIGGLSYGQDTGSGALGGFVPGGIAGTGLFGGYISGIIFGTGTVGGWVRGLDEVSGILGGMIVGVNVGSGSIAGYIRGQEVGSGHFGGLIYAAQAGSGTLGGFMFSSDQASGVLGGFMLAGLQGNFSFDAGFTVEVMSTEDFDARAQIEKTVASDFDAKVVIFQDEQPPLVDIIIPGNTVTGLAPPFNQYFIGAASGQQGKTISSTRWTFGDLTSSVTVSESGAGFYPVQHRYASSGFYIAKFEAIDSDGMHASATRIINAASGIDPVIVSLSGVPRSGDAELIVDFTTTVDILPNSVSIVAQLLNYDDGQSTISFNPTHSYTQPGTYKPIWIVRDSRGVIWCDSLEAGNDYLGS